MVGGKRIRERYEKETRRAVKIVRDKRMRERDEKLTRGQDSEEEEDERSRC
jgi:hypothetical protein